MKSVSIAGVAKSFGGLSVLSGVDLEVPSGSFTAILGSSGSGKTTLLRIIAGFERPDAGVVRLGPRVVDDADHRFVPCERRRIGYVPQEGALFPHLNVGRNVAFGLAREVGTARGSASCWSWSGCPAWPGAIPINSPGASNSGSPWPGPSPPALRSSSSTSRSPPSTPRCGHRCGPTSTTCCACRGPRPILVTHDQDEALSMADQVAVLRGGVIAQINTPSSLYRLPATPSWPSSWVRPT